MRFLPLLRLLSHIFSLKNASHTYKQILGPFKPQSISLTISIAGSVSVRGQAYLLVAPDIDLFRPREQSRLWPPAKAAAEIPGSSLERPISADRSLRPLSLRSLRGVVFIRRSEVGDGIQGQIEDEKSVWVVGRGGGLHFQNQLDRYESVTTIIRLFLMVGLIKQ